MWKDELKNGSAGGKEGKREKGKDREGGGRLTLFLRQLIWVALSGWGLVQLLPAALLNQTHSARNAEEGRPGNLPHHGKVINQHLCASCGQISPNPSSKTQHCCRERWAFFPSARTEMFCTEGCLCLSLISPGTGTQFTRPVSCQRSVGFLPQVSVVRH